MTIIDLPILSPHICISLDGYSGQRDYDQTYLGGNQLPEQPTVNLELKMDNDEQTESFMTWWEEELDNGAKPYLITTKLFGRDGTYIVRNTSPIVHINKVSNTVTVTVEVLYDSEDIDNNPPTVEDVEIFVDQGSRDNYILLSGSDIENDALTFEIELATAHGVLSGTPPQMLYTPDAGYEGTDCFNYRASDLISRSTVGTVSINIGAMSHAEFKIAYTVTAPVRVSGNFHYDLGDGIIRRGTGGYLTPSNSILTIYSNDHNIDERDGSLVSTVVIENWGTRTDFVELLKGYDNLVTFAHSNAIGSCRGTNFSGMFWGCAVQYMQSFDTSNGTVFTDMFRECVIDVISSFDLSNGIYFQRMFQDAQSEAINILNTDKGQYFQDMFSGASSVECIGGINTLEKLNTGGMFDGTTSLFSPDGGEQDDIRDGADWADISHCRLTIGDITITGSLTCEVATLGGTCTSSAIATLNYDNEAGPLTSIVWETNANGTITAGQGTESATIATTAGDSAVVGVRVTINDGTNTTTSSWEYYTVTRTYDFLVLTLPKFYDEINLRTYIDANNPTNETDVVIYNNINNCSMSTGDLTGLDVELINNNYIQAFAAGSMTNATETRNNGLNITSPIKLTNNGWIRGCGGHGGTGGKGANDTYTTTEYETRDGVYGVNAIVNRQCTGYTQIAWDSVVTHVALTSSNGPWWVGGVGPLYRSSYRYSHKGSSAICDDAGYDLVYDIERQYTQTHSRTGGAGGAGGNGASYNEDSDWQGSWRSGEDGSLSSPTGGNSGGTGGVGGWFGDVGYDGANNGTSGYTAGKAITGSALLVAGSTIGNVQGDVT